MKRLWGRRRLWGMKSSGGKMQVHTPCQRTRHRGVRPACDTRRGRSRANAQKAQACRYHCDLLQLKAVGEWERSRLRVERPTETAPSANIIGCSNDVYQGRLRASKSSKSETRSLPVDVRFREGDRLPSRSSSMESPPPPITNFIHKLSVLRRVCASALLTGKCLREHTWAIS